MREAIAASRGVSAAPTLIARIHAAGNRCRSADADAETAAAGTGSSTARANRATDGTVCHTCDRFTDPAAAMPPVAPMEPEPLAPQAFAPVEVATPVAAAAAVEAAGSLEGLFLSKALWPGRPRVHRF